MTTYTNIPPILTTDLSRRALVNFYTTQLEVDGATLDAISGFFTSKGFDKVSSMSIASVFIAQAKKDNINPLTILDTLRGYNDVDLNSLVAEIVNYNRYKTSYLGFGPIFSPNPDVIRNILP